MDDLATQYAGKIKVAKINVDESTDVAMRYQITSIPTFILFKNGQVADRALGALPAQRVRQVDRPKPLSRVRPARLERPAQWPPRGSNPSSFAF